MTTLKTLADARAEILKAELAALVHNLGKLSKAFLAYQRLKARKEAKSPPLPEDQPFVNYNYQAIAGVVADYITSPGASLSPADWQRLESSAEAWLDQATSRVLTEDFRRWLQQTIIRLPTPLNDREYVPGDFIEFQACKWYEPKPTGPRILLLRAKGSRATELLEAAHDAASGGEKEEALLPVNQTESPTHRATAFGYEVPSLPEKLEEERARFTEVVQKDNRNSTFAVAREALAIGLGDTRRPVNDVTLWDLSHSVAGLYKAAVARVVSDGLWTPSPHGQIKWRLLWISFDGLGFLGQAHHVTDMLGRRQVLEDGLNAVRDILEVQYPLGNEVYRDEHGSVFVVPDRNDLLKLEDENGTPLQKLLKDAFDAKGMRGELVPEIKVSVPYLGKKIDLAGVLQTRRREDVPRSDVVAQWWAKGQRPPNAEICTVCGQRPVGYIESGLEPWVTRQKAKDRNVCGVCLNRRGRRARDWARNVKADEEKIGPFERTIWTDEVADDNGRFALVVGRFVLAGWLDGKLVPTMLKSASFARIRRCWDTTRQFWLEVQNKVILDKVGERLRLGIRPANAPALRDSLGRWHTYEADVGGRRLGLCWDPNDEEANDRNLFWTTANLNYLAAQMGITVEKLEERLLSRVLPLYEPGGYLGQDRRASKDAEKCMVVRHETFQPFIPLMVEPSTFMALVPAARALDVVKEIKVKYDREMARVRDRLPLHLGLVFAPRRTPLSAVLEAGRAMLTIPDDWEKWQVSTEGRKATFNRDGRVFEWKYPAKMGDDQTPDVWYPHLLTVDPTTKDALDKDIGDFCSVDNLTDTVYLRPSRFDFEFLDTTARRFEIAYQTSEVSETSEVSKVSRLSRRTRPFLLDDLDRLKKLWEELCHLEKSQRHQLIATIEATREVWFGGDQRGKSLTDGVFRRFVRDTLASAAWPEKHKWHKIDETLREQLEDAGVTGELADLVELHMEILKE